MNCPGSIAAQEGLDNNSSDFAKLGTAAHRLCEECLTTGTIDAEAFLGYWINSDTEEMIDHEPEEKTDWWKVDVDMAGAVQVYVNTVHEEIERLGGMREGYTLMNVEKKFDLSWVRPEMFGTNDCSLVAPFHELVVIDYKHGQGVVVEVEENEQLLYYGVGAAHEEGWDFTHVTLIVVQPRARHEDGPVRRWTIPIERLREFAEELAIAADETRKPNAPRRAGSWCTFCRAAATCPELYEKALEIAQDDFGEWIEVDENTPADLLAERAKQLPILNAFAKAVDTEILRRLKAGTPVQGYKLVRKKSNRKWDGEEKEVLEKIAKRMGITMDKMTKEVKYLGPAGVEKLRPDGLKPKQIKDIIAEYSIKPPGGITVASEDDPREEVDVSSAAEADFDTYEGEE